MQGDLGELPVALRFVNFLNSNLPLLDSPRTSGKTMFDSADVEFRIDHGTAILDPIKFTGSAVSLQGAVPAILSGSLTSGSRCCTAATAFICRSSAT